ncbi:MAG: class I tRNA ligase family protein, partial [Pyrinomonadaceae bacterium]|nr:class I tRNA ligase family protein [Phycisphaerales bacterium]
MTTQPAAKAAKGDEKSRYRATLNLPQTAFAMKANLVQNEPASMKRWAKIGVYQKLRAQTAGKDKYVFHDGPPYANGSIHLGHLMNKTLKDLVVRAKNMAGMDCPYVPGWDCHGLPIEHKVMTELVDAGKMAKLATLEEGQRKMIVRKECQKYAEKYVKLQSEQMARL